MDRLVGPSGQRLAGPNAIRAQAEAVRQEVVMGRLALRVLGILLGGMSGRKTVIRPARFAHFAKMYPGSFVRFSETKEGLTVKLLKPDEIQADEGAETADAAVPAEPAP